MTDARVERACYQSLNLSQECPLVDEEMPFLLMLQEATAAAAGDPDPARPKAVRPVTRATPSPNDGMDAVQMTPELWQRGSYLNHLKNEFSLDLSRPDLSRGALQSEREVGERDAFASGRPSYDDQSESLRTDQLPLLRTKILEDASRNDQAMDEDSQSFDELAPTNGDPRRQAGAEGISTGDDPEEIVLDSHALQSLAVRTAASGLRQIGTYRMARRQPSAEDDSWDDARLSHDDDSVQEDRAMFSVDLGDITPPSLEGLAADIALRGFERSDDDNAREFDRRMRSHFDSAFGADLEAELQRAVRNFSEEQEDDAVGAVHLDEMARSAIEDIAESHAPSMVSSKVNARGQRQGRGQTCPPDEIDVVLERLLGRVDSDASSDDPFEEQDWLFGETVKGDDRSNAVADVHDLSTELSLRRAPARPRRLPRAKRGLQAQRRSVPSSVSAEKTRPGHRIALPWESMHSSLLDSGWEAASDECGRTAALDEETFDDDTIQVSSPEQRAAHRRARELFLGAVERYRAGDIGAAHADALLACVFDPQNPTYKTMTDRWAEELLESRHRAS